MTDVLTERCGVSVLVCGEDGKPITSTQDVLDLIGAAWGQAAEVVAVPVARLGDDFFRLRSGLAGEVMQKFVNYHLRMVILGDISPWIEVSASVRDLVRECNAGDHIWFVANLDELDLRLG